MQNQGPEYPKYLIQPFTHFLSAVAAASIFHFTPKTPLEAKRFLAKNGVAVRTEKNTNLSVISES
jgi:imidazole glycerol phosphate synthase subunit HisF